MKNALILLGLLDDADLDWLVAEGRAEAFDDGAPLIAEGQPLARLYLILRGEVRLTRKDTGEIGRAGAGEILGEVSFVDSAPPSASAACHGPVRALCLPRTRVQARLAGDTGFAARFYRGLAVALAFRLRATQTLLAARRQGLPEQGALTALPLDLMQTASLAAQRLRQLQDRLG